MPKNVSWRRLVKNFNHLGFTGPFVGGRHFFVKKGGLKVIIPNPHRKDISKHLVGEILRQAGISAKEWDNL